MLQLSALLQLKKAKDLIAVDPVLSFRLTWWAGLWESVNSSRHPKGVQTMVSVPVRWAPGWVVCRLAWTSREHKLAGGWRGWVLTASGEQGAHPTQYLLSGGLQGRDEYMPIPAVTRMRQLWIGDFGGCFGSFFGLGLWAWGSWSLGKLECTRIAGLGSYSNS